MDDLKMNFDPIVSIRKFEEFYPILLDLRPHLKTQSASQILRSMENQHYEMLGGSIDGEPVVYAGFREIFDLAHGRHLYIDDLVTSPIYRSKGFGALALKEIERIAKSKDISYLRLCSGLQREIVHGFYEREGWKKKSFAFFKNI